MRNRLHNINIYIERERGHRLDLRGIGFITGERERTQAWQGGRVIGFIKG